MTKTEEIKLQQHQIKSLCEENESLRKAYENEVSTWSHRALNEQRLFAAACAGLRGAIARLETIRETHGNDIALDRDIEIYRAGLPESNGQNSKLTQSDMV